MLKFVYICIQLKSIIMGSIYELKLNEYTVVEEIGRERTTVTRVPGGWIYTFSVYVGEKEITSSQSSVFVPYNDEFGENKSVVPGFASNR